MTLRTTPSTELTRNQRLDRLPVTKKHRKLLWGSGIGWMLDAMDVGLVSFIIAALAVHWDLSSTETSWIASVGFIGMAVGASLGGLLADKIGRRQVFALTLLVYGLATGASALSTGLVMLIVLRFFIGLGLGAELPVASTLVSEYAPRKVRGRMVVILEAFWAAGWILAAIIGTFVVASSENGWRWGLALGAVPAIYALYVRLKLPESVRFLESKGRHKEAEKAVREFEASADPEELSRIDAENAANPNQSVGAPADRVALNTAKPSIFGRELRARTIAFWIVWFGVSLSYYGAFTWIPSLLVADGFTLVRSFSFTLIITLAQLPGYAMAAWLIEVWGRRITLSVFLVGSAGSAVLYGMAGEPWQIIAAGCLLSFFNLGAWGALYAIGPELYPASIRATGTGAAAAFGRLASIIAPLLVPVIISTAGPEVLFIVFGASFAIAAVAAFTLPEQRGKVIDV